MSLTLVTEPARTVGAKTCRFNSANNRMIFELQRADFTITITNSGGYVLVTISDTTGLANGDFIYLHSPNYTDGAYEISSLTSTTFILLDLPYSAAAGAGAFINSDTIRKYYYVEFQVVSGGVTYIMQAFPDSTGLITVDASGVMRRLVNNQNDNPYVAQADIIYMDLNILKSFSYKTLENWNGSLQSASASAFTYYAVNSAIDVLKDSNLKDYVRFRDSTRKNEAKWLTKFNTLTWFYPYFFDISILNGDTDAFFIYVYAYDVNRVQTSFNVLTPTEPIGLIRLNMCGILPMASDRNFYKIKDGYADFETKWIKIDQNDYTNHLYVSWANDSGGREYWLFSCDEKDEIESKDAQTVQAVEGSLLTQNVREFNIPGRSNRRKTIVQDNIPITELEGWLDFLRQENISVLKAKLWDDDFVLSDSGGGEVLVTCTKKHNLVTGDVIRFYYDVNYAATDESVTVADDYTFKITATYYAQAVGIIWRKQLTDADWISCIMQNKSEPIRSTPSAFAIKFDIIYPGFTRKLK